MAPVAPIPKSPGPSVSVSQTQLSRRFEGGLPQELELRYVINFEWKNVRTGQIIRQRKGFEAVGRYVPSLPVSEDVRSAQVQAAQGAADAIVSVMRSDW